MKKVLIAFFALIFIQSVWADETIVLIRHAEKPKQGLGQLTCQGFNRALKITSVLTHKFGTPDAIYAPNPSVLKNDKGTKYSYIRPLATIEPTAIRLGMPVNVQYNFLQHEEMTEELLQDKYKNATIFVAWEHHLAAQIAQDILTKVNGQSDKINWDNEDFDSIYVVQIKEGKATLKIDKQNLNGQETVCYY